MAKTDPPRVVQRAFRDDIEDGDDSDEPKTDPGREVDVRYLKLKLAAEREILEESLAKHDNKLTLRSIVVAVAAVGAAVVTGILFVDNRVQAQVDAGVRVQAAEVRGIDTRVTTLEKRFDRFEERTDKQMNAVLDALRVPETKRPPKLDGGT